MSKDMNEVYRFRTIDNLFGDYNELEKQTIYFADPKQLNDPMEGYRDIYWKGDVIVWKNLFRHYLMCLHKVYTSALFLGKDDLISDEHIPIFSGENDFPSEKFKKMFNDISDAFFSNKDISKLLDLISQRTTSVKRDELFLYLMKIHFLALDTIENYYYKKSLIPSKLNLGKVEDLLDEKYFIRLKEGLSSGELTEEQIDALHTATNNVHNEIKLIEYYNGFLKDGGKNKNFILLEFAERYISQLEKLMYTDWYVACFSGDYTNSSMWGHYTKDHEGVCLVFKIKEKDGDRHIPLERITGVGSSGHIMDVVEQKLYPIKYDETHGQIDFFKSLGRLPRPTLNAIWYTNEHGELSECAKDIYNSDKEWRKNYWEDFYKGITVKSKDWRYENESRLILNSNISAYSNSKNRSLNYEFSQLEGIIFGINTSIEDKMRIIKVIEKKCEDNKRDDFKFYQAFYSHDNKCIERRHMRMLKFKN